MSLGDPQVVIAVRLDPAGNDLAVELEPEHIGQPLAGHARTGLGFRRAFDHRTGKTVSMLGRTRLKRIRFLECETLGSGAVARVVAGDDEVIARVTDGAFEVAVQNVNRLGE